MTIHFHILNILNYKEIQIHGAIKELTLTNCGLVMPHKDTDLVNTDSVYHLGDEFLPHDDVIKWKYFPRYWPFVLGIHRSPVNSPHKGQWSGALICTWINSWVNTHEAGNLRWHHAHYDVTVMYRWTRTTFEMPKYPRRPRDQYTAQIVNTLELSAPPPNRGKKNKKKLFNLVISLVKFQITNTYVAAKNDRSVKQSLCKTV